MFLTTFLPALLLALSVAANPVVLDKPLVTLPITRRLNLTSVHNLVRHDQTRAKALRLGGSKVAGRRRAVINEPVDNQAVTYVASVDVGTPATTYSLIVDTGSSNTWVGANPSKPYNFLSSTGSIFPLTTVTVTYGSGEFLGYEVTDTVNLGGGLIARQSLGAAFFSMGFNGVDGILGIGPADLTEGTLVPKITSASIPTITDNLFSQGVISANVIGISFNPTTQPESLNGVITWGGTDSSKFTGSLGYTPITTTAPASSYWGINQSIRYGASTSILATTAGIVDTGTTLVLIATDAFSRYMTATGGVLDSSTKLIRFNNAQFGALQSLFFVNSAGTFELTANAQIFPRALNTDIGGTSGSIYGIVNDIGANSGQGLDFINGYAFLERFYSVYDTTNKRVGFATTPFTTATSN